MNRIGLAIVLGLFSTGCGIRPDTGGKEALSSALDCPAPLRHLEDSLYQSWIASNESDDTLASKRNFDRFTDLAEKGCSLSQYLAGSRMLGNNDSNGIRLLFSAAEKGNAAAQFELHKEYSKGHWEGKRWVLKDSAQSSHFINLSVAKGFPPALNELAGQKISEAFLLYKQAADSGSLEGIKFVAKSYRYGIGVEGELWDMLLNSYIYYKVGSMLAAPSGQCHDFLEEADKYEKRQPETERMRLKEDVQAWFDARQNLKRRLKNEGKCL